MPSKSRIPQLIIGNWKMYKTIEEARKFVETLAPLITDSQALVYLAVPFTALHSTAVRVKELQASITIGAQNMNEASEGAFTGEIAGKMLREAGAHFVILGHSERRHLFHESDSVINHKIKRALLEGLQPIVCIGETLEQREQEKTEETLQEQILNSLADLTTNDFKTLVLAYEPVWAIGTGKVAHPDDAQKAHLFCRKVIAQQWGDSVAQELRIQYGGSVKPENAADLLAQEEIDGLLVGGASLSANLFSQIVHAVPHANASND